MERGIVINGVCFEADNLPNRSDKSAFDKYMELERKFPHPVNWRIFNTWELAASYAKHAEQCGAKQRLFYFPKNSKLSQFRVAPVLDLELYKQFHWRAFEKMGKFIDVTDGMPVPVKTEVEPTLEDLMAELELAPEPAPAQPEPSTKQADWGELKGISNALNTPLLMPGMFAQMQLLQQKMQEFIGKYD